MATRKEQRKRRGPPRLARVEAVVSPAFKRAIVEYATGNDTTVQALVVAALNNLLENDR